MIGGSSGTLYRREHRGGTAFWGAAPFFLSGFFPALNGFWKLFSLMDNTARVRGAGFCNFFFLLFFLSFFFFCTVVVVVVVSRR